MTTSTAPKLRLSGRRGLQRTALYVLVVSLVVSAAMGVFALLIGDLDKTQAKLLATSLSISGAGTLAMLCAIAWERHRLGVLPPAGIALALLGFALLIVGVWAEIGATGFWKSTSTVLAVAVAAAHASVVSPFGLVRRFRWVFGVTYGLNALVTLLVVGAIWSEPEDASFWRFLGSMAILLAAATIAIPVLRRLGDGAAPAPRAEADLAAHCPRCGEPLPQPGDEACARCGARFRVEFRPGR